jgi:ribonuclease BN (tRNA processing enzyme)
VTSRLVVLGSCGAWPEAGRACSGYVLEHDGFRVVLDLGYATLPPLLTLVGSSAADGVDAVIVTHRHADHALDLHGLFRARWYGHRGAAPLPLYTPGDVLDQLVALEDGDAATIAKVFDWHPLPAPAYRVGPFQLESWELPHYVPNAGVRLSAAGLTVAYTGDTGPAPALAELGRDADLFIVDATDRDQQASAPQAPPGPQLNMTARDAGAAATAAGARRLLLSHFWPGNNRQASAAQAAETFDGEVLLAEENLVIALP